jgi:hypothetical protein
MPILALLITLLSACASNQHATSAVSATATSASTSRPYPTLTPAPPTRTFQQAWGNVPITRLATTLPNNEFFLFENAATPDDQWLVGEITSRAYDSGAAFTPSVALYNIATRRIWRIHTLQSAKSGIAGATVDGDWLAWGENCDMSPGPWSLNIYNLRTGAFRRIVSGVNTTASWGWVSGPIASDGYLMWSQLPPENQSTPNGYRNITLRLMNLSTDAISTLATATPSFGFSWPWAGWVVQTGSQGDGYVRFKNLVTGQIEPLKTPPEFQSQAPSGLALDGATAVYSYAPRQIFTIPDITNPLVWQEVYDAPQLSESAEFPTLNDRLITWSSSDNAPIPHIFDRKQQALVMLPSDTTEPSGAWTGGSLLVWQDPAPAAQQTPDAQNHLIAPPTLCVVDTRTLAAAPPA